MPGTPLDMIDRLCGTFYPVHAKWEQLMPTQSLLWDKVKGKSAQAIIELDLRSIGQFFATADAQGNRSELALLSECLAHLRLRDSQLPKQAMLESEIDKAYREMALSISQFEKGVSLPIPAIDPPLCWQITHYLAGKGKCAPATHEAVADCLIAIANLFVLRDGNITPKEDSKLKVYHAAFGR